jgi:large repetitive protein
MSTATLTWTFPTLRTDGTTISSSDTLSAGLFDSASATPTVAIATVTGAPGSSGTFTTPALSVGTHNYTEVTTDSEGNASAVSNVATITIAGTLAPPATVTDLTATLNP